MKTQTLALTVLVAGTLATGALAPVALSATTPNPIIDFQTGYLLGTSMAPNKWTKTDALTKSKKLPGQRKYRVYSTTKYLGETSGSKAISQGAPCEDTRFVEFSPNSETSKFKSGVIAIGGTWNALPRKIRPLATVQIPAVYRTEITKILQSKGIAKPNVRLAQVWKVDLEGDGVDEVLINATNHNGSNGLDGRVDSNSRAGEYSLIALRKIVRGKVQTTIIEGAYYPIAKTFNAPSVFQLGGVFDVNGDGKMEIVTKGRYYEGDWTTVYSVEGTRTTSLLKVKELLSEGCGA